MYYELYEDISTDQINMPVSQAQIGEPELIDSLFPRHNAKTNIFVGLQEIFIKQLQKMFS